MVFYKFMEENVMNSNQYTDVTHNRGIIYLSYYDSKTKQKKVVKTNKIDNLQLFSKTKNLDAKYKSFIGNYNLDGIKFDKIKQYNDYVFNYSGVHGVDIYGEFPLDKVWIHENFKDEIKMDFDLLNIGLFDIETTVTSDNPDPNNAPERITSMVLYASKSNTYYIFCDQEVSGNEIPEQDYKDANIKFFVFDKDVVGEYKMLKHFAYIMNKVEKLDILSAYFGNLFDFPYIYNRLARLSAIKDEYPEIKDDTFDERGLSPLNIAYKTKRGKVYIQGIQCLDYFELYDKYTYGSPESWKLDFIAKKELGVGKVKFKGGFNELYKNYEKHIFYNYIDVKRLVQLDDKLSFMELHTELSYLSKQNFEDTISPVRTWESILYGHLKEQNKIINPKKQNAKKKYIGAYTHEPVPAFYNYIMSFDLNSLYPHLIMMYFISPETLIPESEIRKMFPSNPSIDEIYKLKKELEYVSNTEPYNKKLVAKAYDKVGDMIINQELDLEFLKDANITMTPSLEFFHKNDNAVLPYFMEHYYDMRKKIKKRKLIMEDELENLKKSNNKKYEFEKLKEKWNELCELDSMSDVIHRMKVLIRRWGLKEKAFKILLNSAYGAFGNAFFRFFDIRLAKGITASGRVAIRSLINALETKLRRFYSGFNGRDWNGSDFFIYSDTDSCVGESKLKVNIDGVDSEISIEDLYLKVGGDKTKDKEMIDISNRNIKSMSFNYDEKIPEMKNTKYIWKHKVKKKMYKIKTKDSEVIITEDHSVIVYRDGEFASIKPSDIIKTDKIIKIIK